MKIWLDEPSFPLRCLTKPHFNLPHVFSAFDQKINRTCLFIPPKGE